MYSMNIKIFFFLAWKKRGRMSRGGTKEQKQTQKEVKKQDKNKRHENYESERLAEGESSLRAGLTQTNDLLTQTQRLNEDNLQSKSWVSAILILMFERTHAPHISVCLILSPRSHSEPNSNQLNCFQICVPFMKACIAQWRSHRATQYSLRNS